MKFKKTYSNGDSVYTIGRFYNTDIRKLCALANYYPYFFTDEVLPDPVRWYTERVRDEKSLFACIKQRKKVVGYLSLDLLDSHSTAVLHAFKKPIRMNLATIRRIYGVILDFAFNGIKMEKVNVTPLPEVKQSVWLARSMGFKEEGLMRRALWYDGKPYDMYIFGMLRKEWNDGSSHSNSGNTSRSRISSIVASGGRKIEKEMA